MKKIMFNDKYGLTQAVLEGRKTMTRRLANYRGKKEVFYYSWTKGTVVGEGQNHWIECKDADEMHFEPEAWIKSHFQVGEIVAIAQGYYEVYHSDTPLFGDSDAGVFNKMFVKAERMPHHIQITSIRVQPLQDISDEDCLKEGVEEHLKGVQYGFPSNIGYCGQYPFCTPRGAFAALIDKVSGKGTWESNPLVWVYEFKLID